MKNDWQIYILRSPRSGVVRYVGSSQDATERFKQHVRETKSEFHKNTPVHKWMKKLLSEGMSPILEIIEHGEGDNRHERELHWINHYSNEAWILNVGYPKKIDFSPETRAKLSRSLKNRIFSAEHCRKISEAKKGCKRPDVTMRLKGKPNPHKGEKLNITEAERQRRREQGKVAGTRNNRRRWAEITENKRKEFSEKMRAAVTSIWAKRSSEDRRAIAEKSTRTRYGR